MLPARYIFSRRRQGSIDITLPAICAYVFSFL
jgi:hypothetical protein